LKFKNYLMNKESIRTFGRKQGIARKLIFYILIFSSFVTLILTSMQLYLEYDRDIQQIENRMKLVEKSYLAPISTSLWSFDEKLLKVQLEGILQMPDMQYLEIKSMQGQSISAGTLKQSDVIRKEFKISFLHKERNIPIGTLIVTASLSGIYQRLVDRVLIILLAQSIKTLSVSIFIFFLFYYLITRHLNVLAKYVSDFDLSHLSKNVTLNRKQTRKSRIDELDKLVLGINKMRSNLLIDITKQKESEEVLLELKEFYQNILENVEDGIWVTDSEDKMVFLNPAMEKISGVKSSDTIGLKVTTDFPEETTQHFIKFYNIAKETLSTQHYEADVVTPTGRKSIQTGFLIPRLRDSKYNGMICTIQDITEKKVIEDEKQISEEKFRSLAENSQDYIMRYDKQHRHLYQNQAAYRVSGFTEEEFVGKTHRELGFDEKLCDLWEDRINEVFQSGESSREIFSWNSEEGTFYLDLRFFPEFDNESNVKTVLGVSRDITEIKEVEEQIKSSLKEKETLLHEIHHRVKNNMQVINSLLELQSNNIEDVKTKEILKGSQSRVYAMSAVHETLHGSENLSKINLKSYLTKITTSIFQTYSIDHQEIKLNNNVEEVSINLNQAYPIGLTINELISNSLKYAFPDERKGEISVNLKQLDKEVELIVMDDGIGIPDALDWKSSKSLGLKLVRTLVENQLDGSIDMEGKNGTKFTIKLKIET
jgi:PAS domain S-box-containing protein